LVYVLPAHRLDSTPPSHDLSNPNRRSQVVNIDVQQASTLRYPNVVVSELVRRSARDDLLRAFSMSDDWAQLNWIEVTLSLLPSPHVDSTMIQLAKGGVQEEQGYLAVLYLAQEGRCWALEQLNRQYAKLPISSMEKVDVVALFSRYKYSPTAENLAETIEAMLVNLGDAALQALIIMYPSGRPNFDGPMAAQSYWKRYVAHHRRDSSASLCISNPVHK
jgi:hypothetical protein